jgi:mono/diheme cytochrome c family protein
MLAAAKAALFGAAVLAAAAIGGAAFVASGIYNIGADDHHTKIVLAIIEQLRERSVGVRAISIEVPPLDDQAKIAAGAARYAALCAGCHMAPGAASSGLRAGLYPHPPNLSQEAALDPKRAFWTIKHGIKMSAMPAWGRSLDDPAIWEMVAFVEQLPAMTPESYRDLARRRATDGAPSG